MTWHVSAVSVLVLFNSNGNCSSVGFFKTFLSLETLSSWSNLSFFTFPFLDKCFHACMVCSNWVWLTAVFCFMLNVSFARISMPVTTGHASYILLLKLLLEHIPPRRLLTLATYSLKVNVNTAALKKTQTKPYCIIFHSYVLYSQMTTQSYCPSASPFPLLFFSLNSVYKLFCTSGLIFTDIPEVCVLFCLYYY